MGNKTAEKDEELNKEKFLIQCVSTPILYILSITMEQEGVCSDVKHLHPLTECSLRLWENSKKSGRTWCWDCSHSTNTSCNYERMQTEEGEEGRGVCDVEGMKNETSALFSFLFLFPPSCRAPTALSKSNKVRQLLYGYPLASQHNIKTLTFLIQRERHLTGKYDEYRLEEEELTGSNPISSP